jgi:Na+-driven multidrug efflux pump
LTLYVFHNYIIRVFTNIEAVHTIFGDVIVLAALAALPDMWQGYLQGVIKALGI